MRFVATIAGFGEAVLVSERLALVGPATVNDVDPVCCRLPDVPVTVSE